MGKIPPPKTLNWQRAKGMTLVELLVAMVIGLLITLAAVSSLIVSRQGFSTVDASSQLRDNGRLAADLIQRVALQAGFKDVQYVISPDSDDPTNPIPANITGFNNAKFKSTDLTTATARTSSETGYGSDVLILRYQTARLYNNTTSSVADQTMIDCAGNPISTIPTGSDDRMVSVFHVAVSTDGEPALMCGRSSNGLAPYSSQPLISGVENFQVLYGVAGFTAVNTSFDCADRTVAVNTVPSKYLRADEIFVGGNTSSQATYNNWRCVRSIRIGMVLRGPPNSSQEKTQKHYYPFGKAKSSATGAQGSALASSNDIGTDFIEPVDGRLRQVVTFTMHLRNDQGL
jgi:type IV pilus assembly protein PilW